MVMETQPKKLRLIDWQNQLQEDHWDPVLTGKIQKLALTPLVTKERINTWHQNMLTSWAYTHLFWSLTTVFYRIISLINIYFSKQNCTTWVCHKHKWRQIAKLLESWTLNPKTRVPFPAESCVKTLGKFLTPYVLQWI